MSEPTSIVPVVSIVTWTISGIFRPNFANAVWHAAIAVFVWRRSWQVSMMSASTPPSMSPSTWTVYERSSSLNGALPRVGSFVPGPIEPTTKRGLSV